MKILTTYSKAGFTLIELLVAIAIIAIIVSIGVSSFLTAQKQARDSRRQTTLLEIQSAFEQYYGEFGNYPTSSLNTLDAAFESGARPLDPKDSGEYVIDYSLTAIDSYCVCAKLESQLGNADAATTTACSWNTTSGEYFCVQNKQ